MDPSATPAPPHLRTLALCGARRLSTKYDARGCHRREARLLARATRLAIASRLWYYGKGELCLHKSPPLRSSVASPERSPFTVYRLPIPDYCTVFIPRLAVRVCVLLLARLLVIAC